MPVERERRKGGKKRKEKARDAKFRAWLKAARLCPVWLGPALGLVLDPAWPTAPLPRPLRLFPLCIPLRSPIPSLPTFSPAISNSLPSLSLARMPNASVWLMRRTHTRPRARAARSSSCFPPALPRRSPFLRRLSLRCRPLLSLRRRRGLEHNAPRRAA